MKTEDEIKEEPLQENTEAKDDHQLDEEDDDSDFEVNSRKLKQKLRKIAKNSLPQINIDEYVKLTFHQLKMEYFGLAMLTWSFSFSSYAVRPADDDLELCESDEDELEGALIDESLINGKNFAPLWVLPLYSLLPSREQAKVS